MWRFLFVLARSLGVLHPDHLLSKLTPRQIVEWWTLYQLEPWGDERDDLRMWATSAVIWGNEGVELRWPYIDAPMTEDEFRAEFDRLKEASDGNGSQSIDSA